MSGTGPRNDATLLDRLRDSPGPLSGEGLARELGVSRVALWKRIEVLREWGYRIESSRRGYRLVRDDGLAPADLAGGTVPVGGEPAVRVLAETVSTMDEARDWALRGAPSGAAVLALRQSSGRGRDGRRWESPPGGLYLSLVLRTSLPPACGGALVLEAARALLESLEGHGIREASFRWPNDIVVDRRKLGGILAESYGGLDRPEFYILGIGLNTAPVGLEGRASAGLEQLGTGAPRRRDLARALASSLRAWCGAPDTDPRRWADLEPDPRRPARAELWDGRILSLRPRGFTPRGELDCPEPGRAVAYGECRKMTYEGEEP